MPTARSRLADIEGAGLGKPLSDADLGRATAWFRRMLAEFLDAVEASKEQQRDAHDALSDLIADATARQLREIDGEDS